MKTASIALGASVTLVSVQHAAAETPWPSQPIRLIVSYSAGGAGDQLARIVGDQLSRDLKVPVVVDNRPGASGMVGGAACKAAAPDGHNYCVFLMDVVTTNPVLFKNVPYKADVDFAPVAFLADVHSILVVPEKSGIRSIKDLVSQARNRPSSTNWGSWGIGSSAHLVLSAIEKALDTKITHVPYQNTPALLSATLTGEVSATVGTYSLMQGHLDQRNLRAIAAMGDKRLPLQPELPTFAEQGVPLKATLWYGIFAPAATSARHVAAMNAATNRAVEKAVAEKKFDPRWFSPRALTPQAFASVVKQEAVVWGEVARQSAIELD